MDYKPYNKSKKSKRYFSDEHGRKALRSSGSLSGTGVLVMCIMVVFYVLRFDLDHELSDVG